MLQAIIYGVRNVARFSGRDARDTFWSYLAFVIVLSGFVLGPALIVPAISPLMRQMQQYGRQHPGQVVETVGPGSYSISIQGDHPGFTPDIAPFIQAVAIVALVVVLLLAAAVSRRLHDRNRSGAWGLLPLPFLAYCLANAQGFFAAPETAALPFMAGDFLYLGSLAYLAWLLFGEPTAGPNRFGEAGQ